MLHHSRGVAIPRQSLRTLSPIVESRICAGPRQARIIDRRGSDVDVLLIIDREGHRSVTSHGLIEVRRWCGHAEVVERLLISSNKRTVGLEVCGSIRSWVGIGQVHIGCGLHSEEGGRGTVERRIQRVRRRWVILRDSSERADGSFGEELRVTET